MTSRASRQSEVAAWLQGKRPDLATTYRAAISMLSAQPEAGHERTRVALICHSMREVMNRLPDAINVSRSDVEGRDSSRDLVQKLPQLRIDYPEMDLKRDAEIVPVPAPAAAALESLIDAAIGEDRRRRSDLAALLTDDGNPWSRAVDEWRELSRYFVKWAHLNAQNDGESPADAELSEKIGVFEGYVDAMRSAFFESKSLIDDILSSANEKGGEGDGDYAVPAGDEVAGAVRRLNSYQLRRVFYEGLRNPHWLKPLAGLGVFTNPPEPEPTRNGYINDVFWPEVTYLLNVAEEATVEVIDVLLGLGSTASSWVRRAAFVIGAKVPSEQAARLKPLIEAWSDAGGFGWRTDPRDLVSFAVNLIEGGQKYGIPFANILFRPREAEDKSRHPVVELKAYWYAEELPRVVNALGDKALRTVLPWLSLYERADGAVGDHGDFSGFSRSTVTVGGGHHDIEDALIDAVRGAAIRGFQTDPGITWVPFKHNPILIALRIAMYSLATALEATSAASVAADLIEIGKELLALPLVRAHDARLEFVALAKALTARAVTDVLVTVVTDGHFTVESEARIRKSMADQGESTESIDESVQRWGEHWQHQVLAGIGRELLPPELLVMLNQLDAKRGVMENPLAPSRRVTSWVGPNSPVDQDSMGAMSSTELLAHLESWHVSGNHWAMAASHEGQGRTLTAVVAANPDALGAEVGRIERLRPTYIRAALSGWEAAFKAELELPWNAVIAVISFVVDHGYESELAVEGGLIDDDPDFGQAKRAAVGILKELAKKEASVRIPVDTLARIAGLLITSSGDEAAWTNYDTQDPSNESGMDPLTRSWNWQWPNAVRGLLHLVAHGPATSWYAPATKALERELARADQHGASRAAIGEEFGRLHHHAPEWLDQHFETYFGSEKSLDRGQQIALTTAITVHFYHPTAYQRLRGSMIAALGETDDIAVGWSNRDTPKARIGQWVVHAAIKGDIDPADPLRVAFYSIASADTRGAAIGHVAWALLYAEKVDQAILGRFAVLWDERAAHVLDHPEDSAELEDFCWFVRCGKFEDAWWLPRLRQVVSFHPELDTHGMIGEKLANAASADPKNALEVLRVLLKPTETLDVGHWDLTHHALAPVIAAAMDAGDDELAREAVKFMNEMGERGEVDLDRRVEEFRVSNAP